MGAQDAELQQLIADLPRRTKRARTRYLAYTITALAVGVLWMAYAFYQVERLRDESERLSRDITEQQRYLDQAKIELKAKNEELQTVAQELRIPLEELHNLKSFGFLSDAEGLSDLGTYVQQSTQAKAELQAIKSPNPEKARRASVPIRYYLRESDNGRVKQAMESLHLNYGFRVAATDPQKEPHTYTNAIWIMRNNITAEDVKLVAYYLIMRGIQVKYIGPPTSTRQRVRSAPESIWVLAEPKAKDEPPLTVERIKDLTLPSLNRGTKTLDW
jgi:vacuolar-type H+-ATPase subunit I/STV1